MKNVRKKGLFLTLLVTSMALVGCGGKGGNGGDKDPVVPDGSFLVKINDGNKVNKLVVKYGESFEKPADPAAPEGKVFYGWKNTENGGQIWNFEDDILKNVYQTVNLEPVFVPANQKAQLLEAELCPDITETMGENGTPGMDGATYSGGAQGKQLINKLFKSDEKGDYEASGSYIVRELEDPDDPMYAIADYATSEDDPELIFSAVVHFMYKQGDTLTWEINSDAAAENVSLFMRLSGEYGLTDPETGELYDAFDDDMFQVKVNDVALEYGDVTIHSIVDKEFITFQDFFISSGVSLKEGANTIQMVVNNSVTLNGTIESTAPVVDCIKVFSSSNISWPKAKISQLDNKGAKRE